MAEGAGLGDGVVAMRPLSLGDVPALLRAARDPAIGRAADWPVDLDPARARERIARARSLAVLGARWELAVADARTGALLGVCGLARRGPDGAELFYWTAPWARGRGVARRAVALLVGWAEAELGVGRLRVVTERTNVAAQRVALACGFRRTQQQGARAVLSRRASASGRTGVAG